MKKVFLKAIALAMALVLVLGSALIALSEDGTQGTTEVQQDTPAPVVVVTPVPEPTVNEETQPVGNTQAPTENVGGVAETETPEPSEVPEGDLETPTPTETVVHPYLRFQESNGELTVVGCDPTIKAAQIPAFEQGLPVMHIGEHAFENCLLLETAEVAEGVKTIGKMAFAGCESLRMVVLPKSIEDIAKDAFVGCNALQAIEAPTDSVGWAFAQSFFAPPATEGIDEEIGMLADSEADAEEPPKVGEAAARKLEALPDPETSIELSGQLQLGAGKSTTLKAIVTSETTIDKTLKWTSSNANVATVSAKGVVTAKNVTSMETVEITATWDPKIPPTLENPKISATLEMTIAPLVTKVTVTGLRTYLDVNQAGDNFDLTAVCDPENTANQTVAWKSSNTAIAAVDGDGKVTVGTKTGAATITATAQDGSGKAGTFKVTVVKAVETVSLSGPTQVAIGKSVKLTPTFYPVDATNKNLTWTSSDTQIATVAGGTVKGVSEGTVIITATSVDNPTISYPMTLTVKPAVESVTITSATSNLIDLNASDKTLALGVTFTPSGLDEKAVWKSSNIGMATVDQSGVVTGIKVGTVTITATALDGSGKYGTYKVTMVSAVKDIALSGPTEVAMGKSIKLTPTFYPVDATNKNLTWTSSDTQIATVAGGIVKGISEGGPVTIKAISQEETTVFDEFEVTVMSVVENIVITASKDSLDLSTGETLQLSAEVMPSTSSQSVVWQSANPRVATVDSNGLVTPVGVGTVAIKALAQDGSGKVGSKTITVRSMVTGVEVTGPDTVMVGKKITLRANVLPATAQNKQVIWSIEDDPGIIRDDIVAKVSNGTVTGVSEGYVTIVATTKDGEFEDRYEVHVVPPVMTMYIPGDVDDNIIDLNDDDPELYFWVDIEPNTADQRVTWRSSNTKVATVDQDGKVTGIAPGVATITATSQDGTGKKASTVVAVLRLAKSFVIVGHNEVALGKSIVLGTDFTPANATYKAVWWESDNENITVSAAGVVKPGRLAGVGEKAEILAITKDGYLSNDNNFEVTVTAPVSTISIATVPADVSILDLSVTGKDTVQLLVADAAVSWKSSSDKIAKVDENGLVTAKNTGVATITATAKDGTGVKATIKITVTSSVTDVERIGEEEQTVAVGKSITLAASVLPSTALDKKLTWKISDSSDPTVAKVSATGVVTGLKASATPVTIIAENNGHSVSYAITVMATPTGMTITGARNYINLNVTGQSPLPLIATVSPDGAAQKVTWKSSNAQIAAVDPNGVVTAGKAGSATITATTCDGSKKSATFKVTVFSGATDVAVSGENTLLAGSKTTLTAAVTALSNANKTLKWTSSNTTVATVDAKGVVTAKAVTAQTDVIITAACTQDPTILGTHTITVWPKASGVMISIPDSYPYIILNSLQKTMQFSAVCLPLDAPQGLVWRSSNTGVASIDQNGLVTAHKVGLVVITATASDGSGRIGRKFLEVIVGVEGLTIQGSADLGAGVTTRLTVVPNPIEATYVGVKKWTSSNDSIATVDADGYVTAKNVTGEETVSITAQSIQNESVFSNEHVITVRPKVESITLSSTLENFDLNEADRNVQVTATVAPSTAKQGVLWSTSDATVATVDENGFVTVLNAGTATITATALDCSGITGTCIVEVKGADYIFEDVTDGVKLIQYVGDKTVTALVIPELVAGRKVVELGDGLFKGYTKLKSASIPSGVKVIPMEAFSGCTALESVVMCNDVTAIKKWAFKGCGKLKGMTTYDAP